MLGMATFAHHHNTAKFWKTAEDNYIVYNEEDAKYTAPPNIQPKRRSALIFPYWVYHNICFRISDLMKVCKYLNFPDTPTIERGYKLNGKEAVIITLY